MGEAMRRNLLGLPPRQVNINADQLKDRMCSCGGMFFTDALSLKEVPAMVSPSGKPETAMFKVGFVCVKCGKVMSLRPEEPKEEPKIELVGGN
jgi:hypothetical protein